MLKRKQNNVKGIAQAPYSSIPGCIGGILLVLCGVITFLNPTEVVKWVGRPFMILPDVLGIVDWPSNDEVGRAVGPQGSVHVVELTNSGPYFLYRSFWDSWGVDFRQYPGITIEGPNGPVQREYYDRNPWLFDTPAAKGKVHSRFVIDETGKYIVRYEHTDDTIRKNFDASLVPDYITGNESTLNTVILVQIIIVLIPLCVFIYYRKIKPMQTQIVEDFQVQDKKRDEMEDFLYDLRKGKR